MVVTPNKNIELNEIDKQLANGLESCLERNLLISLAEHMPKTGKIIKIFGMGNYNPSVVYHVLKKYRDAGWDVTTEKSYLGDDIYYFSIPQGK